jgi:hypothetical protein
MPSPEGGALTASELAPSEVMRAEIDVFSVDSPPMNQRTMCAGTQLRVAMRGYSRCHSSSSSSPTLDESLRAWP